jgi:hypothetical protein
METKGWLADSECLLLMFLTAAKNEAGRNFEKLLPEIHVPGNPKA